MFAQTDNMASPFNALLSILLLIAGSTCIAGAPRLVGVQGIVAATRLWYLLTTLDTQLSRTLYRYGGITKWEDGSIANNRETACFCRAVVTAHRIQTTDSVLQT
jgi:hypothetical protein